MHAKLPPNGQPGVYKISCLCKRPCIGETKLKICTRGNHHSLGETGVNPSILDFYFLIDSYSLRCVHSETNWCHLSNIEHFQQISKIQNGVHRLWAQTAKKIKFLPFWWNIAHLNGNFTRINKTIITMCSKCIFLKIIIKSHGVRKILGMVDGRSL